MKDRDNTNSPENTNYIDLYNNNEELSDYYDNFYN